MISRLAADEDFNENVLAALVALEPDIDALTARAAGLRHVPDDRILEWAARERRVLLSHDRNTMTSHVVRRLANGLPMPGVVIVAQTIGPGAAAADLQMIVRCYEPSELEGRLTFVPLRS